MKTTLDCKAHPDEKGIETEVAPLCMSSMSR